MRHIRLAVFIVWLCALYVRGLRMATQEEELDEEDLAALDERAEEYDEDIGFEYGLLDEDEYGADDYMMYGDEMPAELMELFGGGEINEEMLASLFGAEGADLGALLAALGLDAGEDPYGDDPSSFRLLDEDEDEYDDEYDFPNAEL